MSVILLVVLLRPGGRAGLRQIAKASFVEPILSSMAFLAWIVLVVAVARALGLWGVDLAPRPSEGA